MKYKPLVITMVRTAKLLPWSNPYIQDGLIAYWDGVCNAGSGKHSAAYVWKDLVGDCDLNPVPFYPLEWNSDCVLIQSGYKAPRTSISTSSPLSVLLELNHDYTVEVCALDASTSGGYIMSLLGQANETPGACVIESTTSITRAHLYGSADMPTINRVIKNEIAHYAVVSKNNVGTLILNNSEKSDDVAYTGVSVASGVSFGGLFNTVDKGLFYPCYPSQIYCARVYNRALSAEELRQNYLVDRARFNF